MAVNPLDNAVELFSAPIEGVILALGKGIAEAQASLDQNSIKSQQAIDADPALSGLGLQATWYQMPQVQLELKLAMAIAQESSQPVFALSAASEVPIALPVARQPSFRLMAQPASAAFQNHFNFNMQATSTITLSIVPVPAPRASDQSTVTPRLTFDQVEQLALQSGAAFSTIIDGGKKVPAPNLRFDVNFNGMGRLWYVLQYDAANPGGKSVVVAIDDVTSAVRIIST